MEIKTFSVLSANVGNWSLGCRKYLNNLCYKEVEQRLATNIYHLKPEIVCLQEILATWQCVDNTEKNPKKSCFGSHSESQIRRLLGNDYFVVCDSRNQFECIGVRKEFGTIVECPLGDLSNLARTGCVLSDCDPGFTVSAVSVRLRDSTISFDIVNVHPHSRDSDCRARMISQIFRPTENCPQLAQNEKVLIMGDFNFDPWRVQDKSTKMWETIMNTGWMGHPFRYHSAAAEKNPPYPTVFFPFKRTLDFVVSNFAEGVCSVLGVTPGTTRLDGGRGTDHRAIYGLLSIQT